ncbi:TnsA endonuclease N-terminal domain-containing protein [Aliikangiella sp. IMCC44632]
MQQAQYKVKTKRVKQPKISERVIRKIKSWNSATRDTYQPFVKVSATKRMGRRHLHLCKKQKRIVHLLSDLEYRVYRELVWNPQTIAVYDQVPLDLNETLEIARELNIVHHRNHLTNEAHVVTTDFLVTQLLENSLRKITTAVSVKYSKSLQSDGSKGSSQRVSRTKHKLEIERQYWARRGVGFKIITELDATKTRAMNIDLLTTDYDAELDLEKLKTYANAFNKNWQANKNQRLSRYIEKMAAKFSIERNESIRLFKNCALLKLIPYVEDKILRLDYKLELHDDCHWN